MRDEELIEQIKLGDKHAAEELIQRYYSSILCYCRWHCSDREKAEDLTQETFLKLFRNLPRYKNREKAGNDESAKNFKSYLYKTANHLCIDESRKQKIYSLEEEEEVMEERSEIHRAEDREEIRQLLDMLSPEQREAVILRFGQQLSFREIAGVMECNVRTAQSRVRNALEIMRREKRL